MQDQVLNQVNNQIKELRLLNFVSPYCHGQFDVGYFSWIDFMQGIGVQDITKLVEYYFDTCHLGLIYPLKDFIVVCQKLNVIKKNNKGLHCEDGPAISYNDSGISKWYYLNGVNMKKDHVITPAEKLNPKNILAETI